MINNKKGKVQKQPNSTPLSKGKLAKTVGGEQIVRLVRDRGF